MKKNLINAALLGLLVVAAPACTFVSCKDYDDDFNKVNNRLGDLETARTQINTEITSLKSELQKANDKATALEAKLGDYATKTELANGLAGKADKTEVDAVVRNLNQAIANAAALETRVAALETAKNDLTNLINGKVSQADYNAKVADIEAQLKAADSKITALQGLATAAQGLATTLEELNKRTENQQKTLDAYKARIEALEAKGNAATTDALNALKADLDKKVADLQAEVKTLKDAGFQTEAQVNEKVKAVADRVEKLEAALNVLQSGNVTSLVFSPNRYHEGIEGIESTQYLYNALTVEKAADNNVVEFAKEGAFAAKASAPVTFANAYYHVNPSNAKVDTKDLKNFNFVSIYSYATSGVVGAPAATTPAEENAVNVTSANYEDGVLAVGFRYNLPVEKGDAAAKRINVVALSYTSGEGADAKAVVSDFARIVASSYSTLFIGKASENPDAASIYFKTAPANGGATALKSLPAADKEGQTFSVLSDGTALDLKTLVRTYGQNDENKQAEPIDLNAATASQLKEAGFHYEFALVKDGKNDKSTDAFEITKEGVVKAKFDAEKPYANLGKEAAVRVTLVAPNGEVAAVGYYYLRVTTPAAVNATATATAELKYNCDDNTTQPNLFFDATELTNYLVKQSGLKATEVWNKFDITGVNGEPTQFDLAKGVATAKKANLGKIALLDDKEQGYQFVWMDLKEPEVKALRKAGTTLSTVIEVRNKDNANQKFYFELKWAPGSIQAAPTVAFAGQPVSNNWYANQNVEGEYEQRMHVSIDNNATFKHSLVQDQYIKNSLVEPKVADEYLDDVKAGIKSRWEFVDVKEGNKVATGTNGLKYELSVGNNGNGFYAQPYDKNGKLTGNKTAIAQMTAAGEVEFLNNYVSKVLLNNAAYNELKYGQTLTARVAYVSRVCGKRVAVTGENAKYAEFDLKFIRPLNVNYSGAANFGDATQANQSADIKFDFAWTDWRNQKGDALKAIYKISHVGIAPTSEWTTDLNGGDLETQPLESKFGLRGLSMGTEVAGTPVTTGDFKGYNEYAIGTYPKLHYQTQTGNFTVFKVKIPVYLKYAWGEVKSSITVTVGTTQNQPNARRK